MSVARMLKVAVIGHSSVADELVDRLQRAGALEVVTCEIPSDVGVERVDEEADGCLVHMQVDHDRLYRLDEEIADAQFVRDFLGRFHENVAPFSTFVSEKFHIDVDEYLDLTADGNFIALYRECERMSDRLASIERERDRLTTLVEDLAPWTGLHLQISQWKGTDRVALFTGTVPVTDSVQIRQSLREAVDHVSVAEVGSAGLLEAWVVMAHHDALSEVRSALALTEFSDVSFPDLSDYPAEELSRAQTRIEELHQEHADLEKLAREHAAAYARTYALAELLTSKRDAIAIREGFAASERTFLITGWLPVRRREEVVAALAPVGRDIDMTFEDPGPDDDVPVELENPRLLKPFETLTDLFGRPSYNGLDPTPLMAPFFFLFFGICIGDVGYGALLILVCWLIRERLDVAPGVKSFMNLFMLGGVASILAGIPTRGYFALSEDALPSFLQYKPLFDLPDDAMSFLIFSVALGVVHVLLGVVVNGWRRIKEGEPGRALGEFAVVFFVAMIGVGVLVPDRMVEAIGGGAVVLVLAKGQVWTIRSVGGAFKSLGIGLLGVYAIVGIAADCISYSRLAALGMASLLVGSVMNDLAVMVGGNGGAWVIAGALVFVVGHTFNIVINLLSAFVHPARLQFVEFFGKFYEGGGRPYRPFSLRQQSVVLHSATGEAEGGAAK